MRRHSDQMPIKEIAPFLILIAVLLSSCLIFCLFSGVVDKNPLAKHGNVAKIVDIRKNGETLRVFLQWDDGFKGLANEKPSPNIVVGDRWKVTYDPGQGYKLKEFLK